MLRSISTAYNYIDTSRRNICETHITRYTGFIRKDKAYEINILKGHKIMCDSPTNALA